MRFFKTLIETVSPKDHSSSSLESSSESHSFIDLDTLTRYGLSNKEISCFSEFLTVHERYSIHPITKEEHSALNYMSEWLPDVCFLWTDESSNYAGLFFRGPMRGRVMILNHGETFYAPLYIDVTSFISKIKNETIDELEIPRLCPVDHLEPYKADYPLKVQTDKALKANYAAAIELLESLDLITDEELYAQTAFQAWYLMPVQYLDELLSFFETDNMYILQEISYLFAFHQYLPAIPYLKAAVQQSDSYISSHAKRALTYYQTNK